MRLVIVTGMSGAGKSTALKILEDGGYFCADNLPIALIPKFVELVCSPGSEIGKAALGIDVRSGQALDEIEATLSGLKAQGHFYEILFLDADDSVLVKRYKETRRQHPLAGSSRVDTGIELERDRLTFLKKSADYIIDTSQLLTRELKIELDKIFVDNKEYNNLYITVLSFGFKYGIPTDSDLVFDVRFLPNPFYNDELKAKTGNDELVQDYVMGFNEAAIFLDKLCDMIQFLIPHYIAEGKNQLIISIGCTGGKHRSVTLANQLFNKLKNQGEYGLKVEHRDVYNDSQKK